MNEIPPEIPNENGIVFNSECEITEKSVNHSISLEPFDLLDHRFEQLFQYYLKTICDEINTKHAMISTFIDGYQYIVMSYSKLDGVIQVNTLLPSTEKTCIEEIYTQNHTNFHNRKTIFFPVENVITKSSNSIYATRLEFKNETLGILCIDSKTTLETKKEILDAIEFYQSEIVKSLVLIKMYLFKKTY